MSKIIEFIKNNFSLPELASIDSSPKKINFPRPDEASFSTGETYTNLADNEQIEVVANGITTHEINFYAASM